MLFFGTGVQRSRTPQAFLAPQYIDREGYYPQPVGVER